jgi:hypothetical protein
VSFGVGVAPVFAGRGATAFVAIGQEAFDALAAIGFIVAVADALIHQAFGLFLALLQAGFDVGLLGKRTGRPGDEGDGQQAKRPNGGPGRDFHLLLNRISPTGSMGFVTDVRARGHTDSSFTLTSVATTPM